MMTRSLDPRLRRLEERHGAVDQRSQDTEADAALVISRLDRMAAGYADSDRDCDVTTKSKWSPAEHVAWAIRFAPDRVVAIIREHLA